MVQRDSWVLSALESVGVVIISADTHRLDHLLPAFWDVLEDLDPERAQELRPEYERIIAQVEYVDDLDTYEASDFLNTLMDSINDALPERYYCGASEGDGALFGIWPEAEYVDKEDC